MYLEFEVVTEDYFPDGLRCMRCKRVIEVGQPFTEKPLGMTGDTENVELVCVYC